MLKVILMLVDFNAAETCSDFCTLCFRISKRFNKSDILALSNKIKIKTTPACCGIVFCLSDVYMGLDHSEEVEVVIL